MQKHFHDRAFTDELGGDDDVCSLLILGLQNRVNQKMHVSQQHFLAASLMMVSLPHCMKSHDNENDGQKCSPKMSIETLHKVINLLSSWELMDHFTKEYVSAGIWSMAINPDNRQTLNQVSIVNHLSALYAHERPAGDTDPSGGANNEVENDESNVDAFQTALQMKFSQLLAVRKAAAKAKALLADSKLHKTRQYLMASLYLLLQEPVCQESLFLKEGALHSIVSGLNEPNRKVCATVVGIIWKLAEKEEYAFLLTDKIGIAMFGKRFSTRTRIFALHTVETFMHGRPKIRQQIREDPYLCKKPWGGDAVFEKTVIHLLKEEDLEINCVACISISRMAMSSRQSALLENGAIPALFEVIKRAVFDSHAKANTDGRKKVSELQLNAVEGATMALRNLSVYRPQQRAIAKQGLRTLMQLGIAIDDPQVSSNTKSILHNISLHPKNRTTLYRAQLRSEQAKHRYMAEAEMRRVLKIKSRSKSIRKRIVDAGVSDVSNSIAVSCQATRNETHWDLRRREEANKSWLSVPQSASHLIGHEDRLLYKKQSSLSQLLMRPLSKMFDKQETSSISSKRDDQKHEDDHENLWEPRIVRYIYKNKNVVPPEIDTSHEKYTKSRPSTAAPLMYDVSVPRHKFKAPGRDERHAQSLLRSKFMRPSTADFALSPRRVTTSPKSSFHRPQLKPFTALHRNRTAPAKLSNIKHSESPDGTLVNTEHRKLASTSEQMLKSQCGLDTTKAKNKTSNKSMKRDRRLTRNKNGGQGTKILPETPFQVRLEPEHAKYNRLRFGVKRKPDYSKMTFLSDHPDVKLARWKYVEGNRISQDNYNYFELPDGQLSHFYGKAQLKQAIIPSLPPKAPLPFTMSRICPGFHEAVDEQLPEMGEPPRANNSSLAKMSKCQDSNITFEFKDTPSGAIKFEDTPLLLHVEEIKQEAEVKRVVKKKKWSLEDSVFAPRQMKSDARAFYDNDRVKKKAFKIDFSNLTAKKRFVNMVLKVDDDGGEEEMKEVRDILWNCYSTIMDAFEFYSVMGTSVTQAYSIGLNAFSDFVDDCKIVDKNTCTRKDIDTIFIVANLEEDKQSKTNKANDDRALMRFEFLDCVVRIAIAKYLKSGATNDVSDALKMLCEQNIEANLGPEAVHDSNDFRKNRMYFEDVDKVYWQHMPRLKMIFDVFAAPKVGFSKQSLMTLEEWCKFMKMLDLFDEDFTQREAKLAFAWSQMAVADEVRRRVPFTCITFEDFMEALARVCDMKALPTDKDLNGMTTAQWFQEKLNKGLLDDYCRENPCNFFAKKHRPISDLLPKFLDLVYWKLDRDGDGDFDKADLQRWASSIK